MKETKQDHASRLLGFRFLQPSVPKSKEESQRWRNYPEIYPVIVYRTQKKKCVGPHRFIDINGETEIVRLDRGRSIFRSTCVRPWVNSQLTEDHRDAEDEEISAMNAMESNKGAGQRNSEFSNGIRYYSGICICIILFLCRYYRTVFYCLI